MSDRKRTLTSALYVLPVGLLAVATLATVAAAMSIEPEPVKVTHHNSGPRYDIGAVERTRLSSDEPAPKASTNEDQSKPSSSVNTESGNDNDDAMPIQRVALRRIFLFPIGRPSDWSESSGDGEPTSGEAKPAAASVERNQREQEGEREPSMPSMFAKPFWPFMTPARPVQPEREHMSPPHHRHLFGADEASRSPATPDMDKQASGDQTSATTSPGQAPMIDPIQMMMELMHQAIASQLSPTNLTPADLNSNNGKEASNNDNAPAESSDERPQMPGGAELLGPFGRPMMSPKGNETREDIVEIDGKKYLRKTVTSRHVGENLIFVTRRLIFVPLNETESTGTTETVATTTTTTTTTTEQPTTTTTSTEAEPVLVDRVGVNKPVPSESETATTTAEQATTAASTTTTTTTGAPTEQPTTLRSALPADRAAERVVETTTASKPAEASSEAPKPAES